MADISAAISDEPLDVAGLLTTASGPAIGGIAVFVGAVRESPAVDGQSDRSVVRLEYDAHPTLAAQKLRAIAEEAAARWDVLRVTAVHRTGSCELGEPTVVVACGAAHRREALEACRWIIDEIKSTVPIWKREVYADGAAWVGAAGSGHGA
jgi:molybdopterin synthase catalytic subunit